MERQPCSNEIEQRRKQSLSEKFQIGIGKYVDNIQFPSFNAVTAANVADNSGNVQSEAVEREQMEIQTFDTDVRDVVAPAVMEEHKNSKINASGKDSSDLDCAVKSCQRKEM